MSFVLFCLIDCMLWRFCLWNLSIINKVDHLHRLIMIFCVFFILFWRGPWWQNTDGKFILVAFSNTFAHIIQIKHANGYLIISGIHTHTYTFLLSDIDISINLNYIICLPLHLHTITQHKHQYMTHMKTSYHMTHMNIHLSNMKAWV